MVYATDYGLLVFAHNFCRALAHNFCRAFAHGFAINSSFFRMGTASNFEEAVHRRRAVDADSWGMEGMEGRADSRSCWEVAAGCKDDAWSPLYREDSRAGSKEGSGDYWGRAGGVGPVFLLVDTVVVADDGVGSCYLGALCDCCCSYYKLRSQLGALTLMIIFDKWPINIDIVAVNN